MKWMSPHERRRDNGRVHGRRARRARVDTQTLVLDCGANAPALRVKAALVASEARAHGYAIGQVRGPVVTIWAPESQSVRAMGGDRFRASKAAILDWIAAKIGVSPDRLMDEKEKT
jgi:hypothetical protein